MKNEFTDKEIIQMIINQQGDCDGIICVGCPVRPFCQGVDGIQTERDILEEALYLNGSKVRTKVVGAGLYDIIVYNEYGELTVDTVTSINRIETPEAVSISYNTTRGHSVLEAHIIKVIGNLKEIKEEK